MPHAARLDPRGGRHSADVRTSIHRSAREPPILPLCYLVLHCQLSTRKNIRSPEFFVSQLAMRKNIAVEGHDSVALYVHDFDDLFSMFSIYTALPFLSLNKNALINASSLSAGYIRYTLSISSDCPIDNVSAGFKHHIPFSNPCLLKTS